MKTYKELDGELVAFIQSIPAANETPAQEKKYLELRRAGLAFREQIKEYMKDVEQLAVGSKQVAGGSLQ